MRQTKEKDEKCEKDINNNVNNSGNGDPAQGGANANSSDPNNRHHHKGGGPPHRQYLNQPANHIDNLPTRIRPIRQIRCPVSQYGNCPPPCYIPSQPPNPYYSMPMPMPPPPPPCYHSPYCPPYCCVPPPCYQPPNPYPYCPPCYMLDHPSYPCLQPPQCCPCPPPCPPCPPICTPRMPMPLGSKCGSQLVCLPRGNSQCPQPCPPAQAQPATDSPSSFNNCNFYCNELPKGFAGAKNPNTCCPPVCDSERKSSPTCQMNTAAGDNIRACTENVEASKYDDECPNDSDEHIPNESFNQRTFGDIGDGRGRMNRAPVTQKPNISKSPAQISQYRPKKSVKMPSHATVSVHPSMSRNNNRQNRPNTKDERSNNFFNQNQGRSNKPSRNRFEVDPDCDENNFATSNQHRSNKPSRNRMGIDPDCDEDNFVGSNQHRSIRPSRNHFEMDPDCDDNNFVNANQYRNNRPNRNRMGIDPECDETNFATSNQGRSNKPSRNRFEIDPDCDENNFANSNQYRNIRPSGNRGEIDPDCDVNDTSYAKKGLNSHPGYRDGQTSCEMSSVAVSRESSQMQQYHGGSRPQFRSNQPNGKANRVGIDPNCDENDTSYLNQDFDGLPQSGNEGDESPCETPNVSASHCGTTGAGLKNTQQMRQNQSGPDPNCENATSPENRGSEYQRNLDGRNNLFNSNQNGSNQPYRNDNPVGINSNFNQNGKKGLPGQLLSQSEPSRAQQNQDSRYGANTNPGAIPLNEILRPSINNAQNQLNPQNGPNNFVNQNQGRSNQPHAGFDFCNENLTKCLADACSPIITDDMCRGRDYFPKDYGAYPKKRFKHKRKGKRNVSNKLRRVQPLGETYRQRYAANQDQCGLPMPPLPNCDIVRQKQGRGRGRGRGRGIKGNRGNIASSDYPSGNDGGKPGSIKTSQATNNVKPNSSVKVLTPPPRGNISTSRPNSTISGKIIYARNKHQDESNSPSRSTIKTKITGQSVRAWNKTGAVAHPTISLSKYIYKRNSVGPDYYSGVTVPCSPVAKPCCSAPAILGCNNTMRNDNNCVTWFPNNCPDTTFCQYVCMVPPLTIPAIPHHAPPCPAPTPIVKIQTEQQVEIPTRVVYASRDEIARMIIRTDDKTHQQHVKVIKRHIPHREVLVTPVPPSPCPREPCPADPVLLCNPCPHNNNQTCQLPTSNGTCGMLNYGQFPLNCGTQQVQNPCQTGNSHCREKSPESLENLEKVITKLLREHRNQMSSIIQDFPPIPRSERNCKIDHAGARTTIRNDRCSRPDNSCQPKYSNQVLHKDVCTGTDRAPMIIRPTRDRLLHEELFRPPTQFAGTSKNCEDNKNAKARPSPAPLAYKHNEICPKSLPFALNHSQQNPEVYTMGNQTFTLLFPRPKDNLKIAYDQQVDCNKNEYTHVRPPTQFRDPDKEPLSETTSICTTTPIIPPEMRSNNENKSSRSVRSEFENIGYNHFRRQVNEMMRISPLETPTHPNANSNEMCDDGIITSPDIFFPKMRPKSQKRKTKKL